MHAHCFVVFPEPFHHLSIFYFQAGLSRPRMGSLPPPDRVNRARLQSDIEVDNLALFSDEE